MDPVMEQLECVSVQLTVRPNPVLSVEATASLMTTNVICELIPVSEKQTYPLDTQGSVVRFHLY